MVFIAPHHDAGQSTRFGWPEPLYQDDLRSRRTLRSLRLSRVCPSAESSTRWIATLLRDRDRLPQRAIAQLSERSLELACCDPDLFSVGLASIRHGIFHRVR